MLWIMKVLIACEFSGVVRDAFAAKSWDAWSCDIIPSEREGNHILGDVREVLGQGWDMMIGHPPCKYLSYAGSRVWNDDGRKELRDKAMEFFMELWNAPIKHIALENPLGEPVAKLKPTQKIHPYYFGAQARKRTLLWLKNLPPLLHSPNDTLFYPKTWCDKGELIKCPDGKIRAKWYSDAFQLPPAEREKVRSRTFPEIAEAMATQWTKYIKSNH